MKLTKETIELIKKLYSEGKRQFEIVKELNIDKSQVNYWTTSKEVIKERIRKYQKNLSKAKKKEISKRKYPYLKNYLKERYKNDEEFRNKIKEKSKEYQRKRREK